VKQVRKAELLAELPSSVSEWSFILWNGGIICATSDHAPIFYKDGQWFKFEISDLSQTTPEEFNRKG